eukprot:scaffold237_cov233-Pinguiococcus_pyrenoidosus.AAC.12
MADVPSYSSLTRRPSQWHRAVCAGTDQCCNATILLLSFPSCHARADLSCFRSVRRACVDPPRQNV